MLLFLARLRYFLGHWRVAVSTSKEVIARSFEKKMAAARKASVNSHLGFVVPKLTGHEALHFMRSVGGFALSSKVKTSKPKS